ncbi:Uncharacterized protein HSRCO_1760 [Halanaeroarchaeum sp. HSR-CO]|uniref:DUF7500 family protein n=1 Tax=Halanaeroarchaeum sp. HSR-CO TaxID=2866382 RepID=UPI00217DEF82|nr:hypothetical protein [Halanaeroarchaeum sp. HSR-CO]UWG48039.1 Uncharacterized protein HSRCO_1760 [Halanaeroarchaeum sp. HSR-CO]
MDPPRDGDDPPDDNALSPEDLDISSEEEVSEIADGRFVIGADGPPKMEAETTEGTTTSKAGSSIDRTLDELKRETGVETPEESSVFGDDTSDPSLTGTDVKRWISAELDRTDSQYAYRIAAKTGESIQHQQLASDDIGTAFDGLLLWYTRQVAGGTPVEEALGILLAESSIGIRYPIAGMLAYLEDNDLEPEDSIADLLETIRDSDGLVFPLRPRE